MHALCDRGVKHAELNDSHLLFEEHPAEGVALIDRESFVPEVDKNPTIIDIDVIVVDVLRDGRELSDHLVEALSKQDGQ